MMPKVELIYDADCPNVETARTQLRVALDQTGQSAKWTEWDRSNRESPGYVRYFGSPTILVDGRDVAGEKPSDETNCCRLYRDGSGELHGVPSVEAIATAMGQGGVPSNRPTESFRVWLPIVPAVVISLLPKLACPACWPAYAGLLSAVGLGFLIDTTYLLPLTVLFLVWAVGALGWRAGRRKGFGPFVLGLMAAIVVIVGKFSFSSDPAMYGGIALLITASLWNSWPKRSSSPSCPACEPVGHLHRIQSDVSQ